MMDFTGIEDVFEQSQSAIDELIEKHEKPTPPRKPIGYKSYVKKEKKE